MFKLNIVLIGIQLDVFEQPKIEPNILPKYDGKNDSTFSEYDVKYTHKARSSRTKNSHIYLQFCVCVCVILCLFTVCQYTTLRILDNWSVLTLENLARVSFIYIYNVKCLTFEIVDDILNW